MEKLTDEELLKFVEYLVSQDISEKCKDCSSVYMAVHSHREDTCCKAVHEDWRNTAIKAYQELRKFGEI